MKEVAGRTAAVMLEAAGGLLDGSVNRRVSGPGKRGDCLILSISISTAGDPLVDELFGEASTRPRDEQGIVSETASSRNSWYQ
jgi:hypothetical protein